MRHKDGFNACFAYDWLDAHRLGLPWPAKNEETFYSIKAQTLLSHRNWRWML